MTITLYELAAADRSIRFSPHCWKSRLALAHKELLYLTEPVTFTEKEKIAMSKQALLPVLCDGDVVVNDSWKIALYLEEKYPDAPSLFADNTAKARAEAFNQWVDTPLAQHIRPMIIVNIFTLIDEKDKAYFRRSREEKLGMTLEQCEENAPKSLLAFTEALSCVRETLGQQKYLGGEAPDYSDICLLGMFLWVACVSEAAFLAEDDVVYTWYQNMLRYYQEVIPAHLLR
jgi:glutathione S-transferase